MIELQAPVPSIVRPAKIATIEVRDAEKLGTLPRPDRLAVARFFLRLLSPLGG